MRARRGIRRDGRLATALGALALGAALLCVAPVPASAQSPDAGGTTFVTPFPANDTYRIQVFGESLAEGLLNGLVDALSGEPRVEVLRKHRRLGGLFRPEYDDDSVLIDGEFGRDNVQIAVVMLNPADRYPWRQSYPRQLRPGSETWKEEFDRRRDEWKVGHAPRLDELMRTMKRRGVAAYFVGLPILRRQEATDDAQAVNELVRERAYVNGMKFIDVLSVFADEDGVYSAQGPDLTGRIRQLRENDGVHFTAAGYRKLAHFIERDIKRDIAQARTERSIPLAGTEAEQKRIRPAKLSPQDAPGRTSGQAALPPGAKSDRLAAQLRSGPQGASADGSGDLRAENARITIKSLNAQGREDAVTIDILRPSIPANVIQLVTRRESADKASLVGDPVMSEIGGGAMLLSSITPTGDGLGGETRRTAPTNTPFFRALVKGERLEAKPGRADDFPWPRPEVPPQQQIEPTAAPVRAVTQPQPAKGPARNLPIIRKPPSRE